MLADTAVVAGNGVAARLGCGLGDSGGWDAIPLAFVLCHRRRFLVMVGALAGQTSSARIHDDATSAERRI